MFHFRKKTKVLPIDIVHRKRVGFVKKPAVYREIHPIRKEKEDRIQRSSFYWIYRILWVLFLGVTVYVLVFSSFLQLNTIHIDGTSAIPEQDVDQFIRQALSEKYFGIIPKNNMLVFSRTKIEANIKDRFKKIQSVDMTQTFPHTLTVHIEERKTLVLWCVSGNCLYVDENGYAYAPVDASQPGELTGGFLKITDTSGQDIDTNEPLLDNDFMRFAVDVRDELRNVAGVEVDAECATPSRFSDELILTTQEGWKIYISVRLPLEKSVQTLKLLFKKEISDERRQHLKYVDLRTENKVYYSVEGESVSAPAPNGEQLVPTPTPTPAEKDKKKK